MTELEEKYSLSLSYPQCSTITFTYLGMSYEDDKSDTDDTDDTDNKSDTDDTDDTDNRSDIDDTDDTDDKSDTDDNSNDTDNSNDNNNDTDNEFYGYDEGTLHNVLEHCQIIEQVEKLLNNPNKPLNHNKPLNPSSSSSSRRKNKDDVIIYNHSDNSLSYYGETYDCMPLLIYKLLEYGEFTYLNKNADFYNLLSTSIIDDKHIRVIQSTNANNTNNQIPIILYEYKYSCDDQLIVDIHNQHNKTIQSYMDDIECMPMSNVCIPDYDNYNGDIILSTSQVTYKDYKDNLMYTYTFKISSNYTFCHLYYRLRLIDFLKELNLFHLYDTNNDIFMNKYSCPYIETIFLHDKVDIINVKERTYRSFNDDDLIFTRKHWGFYVCLNDFDQQESDTCKIQEKNIITQLEKLEILIQNTNNTINGINGINAINTIDGKSVYYLDDIIN